MKVYEMIQKLAEFDANDTIEMEMMLDTVETLQIVSEDSADGKSQSYMTGLIDSIEGYKNINAVSIKCVVY